MHQPNDLLKVNVKVNLEVNVVDLTKNRLKISFSIPKLVQDKLQTHYNMVVSLEIKNNNHLVSECTN